MFINNGHTSPSMEYVAYWIVLAYVHTVFGVHTNGAEQSSFSTKDVTYSKCSVRCGNPMIQLIALDTPQGFESANVSS